MLHDPQALPLTPLCTRSVRGQHSLARRKSGPNLPASGTMPLNMSITRKWKLAIVAICAVFVAATGNELAHWLGWIKPLGQSPPIEFPIQSLPKVEAREFLEGDFRIITDVRNLPGPVLQAYTEVGGTRLLMANPGKKFQVTDVVSDSSLPFKRLIFAGVLDDKCFVHYEHGGRGFADMLSLFSITSAGRLKPAWQGYCNEPSSDILNLRAHVADGSCRESGR